MPARILKILLSLPFLIAAGVFGLYLLFGFFLVNPLAQKLVPWIGKEKLASQLSVQEVRFNPFTLETTVRGLQLAEPDGSPLAGFERLYLNVGTAGLLRWAWRIQDIQIDAPRATFEVDPDGRLNWQALLDKLSEDKKPPSDRMVRILVDHIKITDGDIDYIDAHRPGEPFRVSFRPLGIELDGLSTLPEDRGDYLIAAKLPEQGGTLKWKGDIALNPPASAGAVALENVRLGTLLHAIKTPRAFDIPSGTLAAALDYQFAMVRTPSGEDAPWVRVTGARLVVQDLAVTPAAGGEPVLKLGEARIEDAGFDLASHHLDVARVSLTALEVTALRAQDGTLNIQTLFAAPPSPSRSEATTVPDNTPGPVQDKPAPRRDAASPAWKIDVREIALADGRARFTDQGFAAPLTVSVDDIAFTAALTGEVGEKADLAVTPIGVSLGPVRVASAGREVASLARAELADATLRLADATLDIESVTLTGIRTEVARAADQSLNWQTILAKAPGAPARTPTAPATAGPSHGAFAFQLARFSVRDIEIGVVDAAAPKPVRLDITQGAVTLRNLSLDLNRAVPVEASFALKQGGRFTAQGNVTPGQSRGTLALNLAALPLKPFAPYVNQFARLDLQSGHASTRGQLVFSQPASGFRLDYGGGFSVDDLAITEEDTGEAFLGWTKLASDSLELRLGPNRLAMRELLAQNLFSKFIIFEDKSVNLVRVLRRDPDADAAKPGSQDPPAAPATEPAFPVAIDRIRIADASAEFADLSLTPQFGTRMHALSGVITGLSTDPKSRAQVELDGKVDDYGSARVRGAIQPFQATAFTDLGVAFRNLEMTNLTPYSGKFAGRRIDSGTLSVDLEYKINDRQLAGENKFIVNKLKLGERVESPDAMNLPLDLAIALLQDRNGIIDLELPVSGSLDDPQFSYGKIVWRAIVNVLTKLVTAPFRALGNLLGGEAEKFESVVFDPGASQLLPPEQGKLRTLADALAKRPALTLKMTPGYDPEADRRALQVQAIRLEAAKVAGIKLAPGEAPGPVDVNLYAIQTWLEDAYQTAVGKAAYQTLRETFRDKNASAGARMMENETVERLARRFKTRDDGPASAFHTELLERMTQRTTIDDATLVKLGEARGQAVRSALMGLGLEAGRMTFAAPEVKPLKDRFVGSSMSLGAGTASTVKAAPAAP